MKKKIATGLVLTVIVSLLAGCSGSNKDATAKDSKSSGSNSSTPKTISMIHYMGEQSKRDGLDGMLAQFKKDNPNTNVDVQIVSSAQYLTIYKTRITANDAPDIFMGKPRSNKEFIEGGQMMDISDASYIKDILPILSEECTINGKYYAIPIDAQVKGTFYNKKIFQDNNIKVPTTRDEFFKAADTLAAKGINPFSHAYNFLHGPFHELDAFATSMADIKKQDDVWVNLQSGKGNLSGNAMMTDAFTMLSKLASYKDAGDSGVDQPQAVQDFAAGKRAMFINGGWIMGDVIAANPKGEFGMFPTPWSNNPEENKLWVGIDDAFMVSSTTKNKDEVYKLLGSFVSEDSGKVWMSKAKMLSSREKISTDNADPFIKEIKGYIDSGKYIAKSKVVDLSGEYSTSFRTILQEFVSMPNDKRDVNALLKRIDDEMARVRK